MTRPHAAAFAAVVLALLLFAEPTPAGVVLCVGADGHVAFEPSRDGLACADREPASAAPSASSCEVGSGECVDSALAAPLAPSKLGGERVSPLVLMNWAWLRSTPLRTSRLGPLDEDPLPAPSLALLGSVVLRS
jgi:hypothetical protein